jgi:cyclopropane-fatty-acyl-phospholipid synthase
MRVLDIGCGWGGLALRLAARHGVRVTGVTLSAVQLAAARARAQALGLQDRVEFRLQDYRHVPDQFDRVVSVGMMEHVGQPQYATYFNKIHDILAPDGVALIHFIGRSSGPSALSPWFQKYIFPGGYAPAFSEVIPKIEGAQLVLADLEVWRGHYEQTLRHWQQRFEAALPQVRTMYDEAFVRMWRYYLVSSELSFTEMKQVLFQAQLTKARLGTPPTRRYLYPP